MSDFTSIAEVAAQFSAVELDSGVDFHSVGDAGVIVTDELLFNEGGFGEGGFGGTQEVTIITNVTDWTDIDEP